MGHPTHGTNGVLKRTSSLLNNKVFSDVEFHFVEAGATKGKVLYAHKLILSMAGEGFAKLFYNTTKNHKSIKMVEYTPRIFEMMLRYVYCDQIEFTNLEDVVDLIKLSKTFGIYDLRDLCNDYISKYQLNIDTVFAKYETALGYRGHELLPSCRRFVCHNTKECLESPQFCNASQAVVEDILKQDGLTVSSEMEVIEAAILWGNAECERKNRPAVNLCLREALLPLFKHLRFLCLNVNEILDFVEKHDVLISLESTKLTAKILNPENPSLTVPNEICAITTPRRGIKDQVNDQNRPILPSAVETENSGQVTDSQQGTISPQGIEVKNSSHVDGGQQRPKSPPTIDERNFGLVNGGQRHPISPRTIDASYYFHFCGQQGPNQARNSGQDDGNQQRAKETRNSIPVAFNSNTSFPKSESGNYNHSASKNINVLKPSNSKTNPRPVQPVYIRNESYEISPPTYPNSDNQPLYQIVPPRRNAPVLKVVPQAKPTSVFAYEFPLHEMQKEIKSSFANDLISSVKITMQRGCILIRGIELKVRDRKSSNTEKLEVHLCFSNDMGLEKSDSRELVLKNNTLELAIDEGYKVSPGNPLFIEVTIEDLKLDRCSVFRSQESECELNWRLGVSARISLTSNQSNGTDSYFFLISKLIYNVL